MPEVSVIILTYRQPATIARAIESVVAQQVDFSFEILLADDCSPDATGAVCRDYARRYPELIRLVDRPTNLGLVDSYFDCVSQARGRFIADCAGDDYWVGTDRLQALYDLIAHDDSVQIAHGDWLEVDSVTGESRPVAGGGARFAQRTSGREMLRRLLAHERPVALHLSTALYRRATVAEALCRNRGLVHNRDYWVEDLPVMAALLARGDAAYLPRPVLAYSVGHESVSAPRDMRRSFGYYYATTLCTLDLADHYGFAPAELGAFVAERVNILSSLAFRLGDPALSSQLSELIARTGCRGSWKTRLRRLLTSLRKKVWI